MRRNSSSPSQQSSLSTSQLAFSGSCSAVAQSQVGNANLLHCIVAQSEMAQSEIVWPCTLILCERAGCPAALPRRRSIRRSHRPEQDAKRLITGTLSPFPSLPNPPCPSLFFELELTQHHAFVLSLSQVRCRHRRRLPRHRLRPPSPPSPPPAAARTAAEPQPQPSCKQP